MSNELLSFIERDSVIHRLNGATKLICFLLLSGAAMFTYDTRVLLVIVVLSMMIFIISKVKIREIGFILGLILLFLVLNNVAIFLFAPHHGTVLYGTSHPITGSIGRYSITLEQLFYQMNITLKYIAVIPPALLFIITTHPSEFAASLNKVGVSYRLSYSVSIALRYIPDIQRDFKTIARSQQARGIDMSRKEKMGKRIKNASAILLPLILSSLDRIDTISNIMELRGFGKHKKRTWYSYRSFATRDFVAILIAILVFGLMIIFIFVNGGRFYNPFTQ